MGTLSSKKFLKNVTGTITEEAALLTSAGAADANKLPALGATGVLDITILNGIVVSTGPTNAGQTPILDSTGRLDVSVMPVGIVPETSSIIASEALAAGDLVNVWNNSGVANARKADGSTSGKECHGFVLSAFSASATALVYFEGSNTQVSGLTPGLQFLSGTAAGKSSTTAASASGSTVQRVGLATTATNLVFQAEQPIVLA
jgi:hypothetical protein